MKQLLLTRSKQGENKYGPFLAEILTSEGLTGFERIDLDTAGWPELGAGDLVVLTRCFLVASEIERLWESVNRGARLVCVGPSPRLARRFGWMSERRVVYPGWIKIRNGYPGAVVAVGILAAESIERGSTPMRVPDFRPGKDRSAGQLPKNR